MKRTLALLFLLTAAFVFGSAENTEHGLILTGMDRSVKPGDDFYGYSNGNWMKQTEIPPDRSNTGSFPILAEKVNRQTSDLIQEVAKSANLSAEEEKVADYYNAYMNEAAIEAKGMNPVKPELDQINAIKDKTDLARFLGSQMRVDVDPLNNTEFHTSRFLGLWVSPDFDKPNSYAAYLLQGGLGMPDRDYYLQKDEKSAAVQEKYRKHITTVLTLAGVSGAAAKADHIYDLELKIAQTHVSRTDSLDVLKAHNRWLAADFPKKAPGLDWTAYMQGAGLSKVNDLFVWHPSAITGEAALIGSEPLEVWKDYLIFHAIDRNSPVLSKAFAEENFAFYGTAVLGTAQNPARWKRAVAATNAAVGDAVGKLYVKRYFPPSAKAEAQEMVRNIQTAFDHRIDALSWMTPATREKAKAKVKTLYVGIGYPEKWQDYSPLKIAKDDAFGNLERSEMFTYEHSLSKLGKPVDKTEWSMTPQTVNAVNLPLQNALNFPAAILQPPFFDAQTDRAQNYGGIGTTIGHEISHSFDDQGSQFDAEGRLTNWWTPEDFAHFRTSADRLAAQYDQYEPIPGMHINGKLTLSENIADVAGISASYDGYRASYNGKEGPSAQGFTGDQRFFLSFGQIWRFKIRPEAMRNLLLTNGHSPGEFRADTVRNLDAWYPAFQVKEGDRLYLPPDQRIRVW